MYNSITVAVAGAGFIGPVHVEGLRRLGIRVKGLLGKDLAESTSACKQLNLEHPYATFEDLLADEDIDAVHLAVPNVLHYPMVKQALAAGKHVMCEKPLAMTSEQGAELVELARNSNLKTAVNYNLRFYPINLEVRDRLKDDNNRIFAVTGSYQQDWLLYDTDYNWRVLADQGGALRAVSDIGTHWLDLVHFLTGLEAEAVLADLTTVHPQRKRPLGEVSSFTKDSEKEQATESIDVTTDDCASILFKFKGGARGQLFVSQVSAGHKNQLKYDIATQDAAYEWNSERPNELSIGKRGECNQVLMKDPGLMTGTAAPYINYPGGHNEGFPDTFKQCFRSFYDAVLGDTAAGEELYATFTDGHQELILCDAILKSNEEQGWVYL
ncbi:putative dehydrogenase [Lewinella aquimaris]|uniref:Putative dehydrogenase n=1 Tax=Neolewinella aquimaris TaxID=1835722 RepID=A0A840E0Y6_9BACT|nr:Gfo/Idh/MocA family oxidoreductase [Neolewinella aquimaris]MBB4079194.1 putative dehydrogenase [Neolewinella aquimaris]